MIDTRPDLTTLLVELTRYHCTFGAENEIYIEIPQFKNKLNESWYGLMLVCKPNRTSIEVYICKSNPIDNQFAFIDSFEDIKSLDDLITKAIEKSKICSICGKTEPLNKVYIHNNKHICKNCYDNVRCKF